MNSSSIHWTLLIIQRHIQWQSKQSLFHQAVEDVKVIIANSWSLSDPVSSKKTCFNYWDRYYSVQVLEITTLRLNIGCCSPACLFLTDWYSSARRVLNKAPYVHTYEPALHAVSYNKNTDIHTRNNIYGTHENLPNTTFLLLLFMLNVIKCLQKLCYNQVF